MKISMEIGNNHFVYYTLYRYSYMCCVTFSLFFSVWQLSVQLMFFICSILSLAQSVLYSGCTVSTVSWHISICMKVHARTHKSLNNNNNLNRDWNFILFLIKIMYVQFRVTQKSCWGKRFSNGKKNSL